MIDRRLTMSAALSAALAIAAGAFAAHAVTDVKAADWLAKGAHYQLIHAVAVVILAATGRERWPARFLLIGASIFAATLYAMAAGAPRWLGAITPVGGVMMIVGWLWIALNAALRQKSDGDPPGHNRPQ